MTKSVQILLVIALQWFRASPFLFQDINIKRSFDISIKPLPLTPLTFIMEKWTPLGLFRKKHAILKRDLESIENRITMPHAALSIDKQYVVVPTKDEELPIYVPKHSQEAVNAISITPERIPAAVSEEIEPITVAPLYVNPLIKPVVPQQAVDTEKDLQLVTKPQMRPELEAISKLGTVVMPADFKGIIRPFLHLPPANVTTMAPFLSESHSTMQSIPSPVLLPPVSQIQIMGSLPDLEQVPIISNSPVPALEPLSSPPQISFSQPLPLPPSPTILQNEPVLIKNHYAHVAITPLPPVSMIIPPALVESPASPSQFVPIEIKTLSTPGSVLLPPESGPVLTSVTTTIMEDNAAVTPIGATPAFQPENRSQNLLANIFKPTLGLTSNQMDVPPENNSVIETPKIQNENVIIKGSKLALYFGNVIFKLMSQFFNDARVTLDQLTSAPPIYQN